MKIQNPFRLGLIATLGVGVGLLAWGAFTNLATVFTYIGAALFLALGIDPVVRWLEKKKLPRWAALVIVLIGIIGIFVGIVLAIVPQLTTQIGGLVDQTIRYFNSLDLRTLIDEWEVNFAGWGLDVDLEQIRQDIVAFFTNSDNLLGIGGGVISVGLGIANGLIGAFIIIILMLYFTASLPGIKRAMYQFAPASKRSRFAELSEQISDSVGRYVIGQASVATIGAIVGFIYLTIIQAPFPIVLAFISFLLALIPLVGTITAGVINTLFCLLLGSPATAIAAGIFYLIYMQVESYVVGPNIMRRAVSVPGAVVVVAALAGGALLGIMGALIAIPVAAAVMLIVREVVIPKQNEL